MEWWIIPLILFSGAFGGLVNAIMSSGERYRVSLPAMVEKDVELGMWGPIIIGVAASLVAWTMALHETTIYAQVGGCFLAGMGGSSYLTSKLRIQNLQGVTEEEADALADTGRALADQAASLDDNPSSSGEGRAS